MPDLSSNFAPFAISFFPKYIIPITIPTGTAIAAINPRNPSTKLIIVAISGDPSVEPRIVFVRAKKEQNYNDRNCWPQ